MKYCDYCDPNYGDFLTERTAQIQKHDDTYALAMLIDGIEFCIAIEYCPKCGRKLTEEE